MKTGSSPGFYPWTSTAYRGTAAAGWTRSRLDHLGRVVEVGHFSGAAKPSAGASPTLGKTATAYDGEYTTVTDPAGKTRRSRLDGLGRLVRVDEPTGSPGALGTVGSPNQGTSYTYSALDNLTGVTQGSQTRTFAYDSLSRLTSAANPESGTVAYTYDNNGNLTQRTDARESKGTLLNYWKNYVLVPERRLAENEQPTLRQARLNGLGLPHSPAPRFLWTPPPHDFFGQ